MYTKHNLKIIPFSPQKLMSAMSTTGCVLLVTGSGRQGSGHLICMIMMTSSAHRFGVGMINRRSRCVVSMMTSRDDCGRSSGKLFRRPGSSLSVSRSSSSWNRHWTLGRVGNFGSRFVVAL